MLTVGAVALVGSEDAAELLEAGWRILEPEDRVALLGLERYRVQVPVDALLDHGGG